MKACYKQLFHFFKLFEMLRKHLIVLFLGFYSTLTFAQGQLSGDFMLNSNFYIKDTTIQEEPVPPQYLHDMSSAEAWLYLNYQINGFAFAIRYDLFNNSPLLDPYESFSRQGIGLYSVSKTVDKFSITAGTFYDQFGSGIIFRAYEDRIIGLDYAIRGVSLKYNFGENFFVKAFTGQQKNRFEVHPEIIKGINIEKDFKLGDNIQILPGAALVNRTLTEDDMTLLADEINSYDLEDRFVPKYNVYAYTFYNTLTFKDISWYVEYAMKTNEAIKSRDGSMFIDKTGNVFFTDLGYSTKGFGISLQYKRTETFPLRTSPYTSFNVGVINYMPPMSKQTSRTLPARYNISAKDYFEESFHAELNYSPNKKNTFSADYTIVLDDVKGKIYNEVFFDYYKKFSNDFKALVGVSAKYYDKKAYENDLSEYNTGVQEDSIVYAYTPFAEVSYKLSKNTSLRAEFQYMFCKQDYGDFLFALLELNIAPHWSFSVSDMINTVPLKYDDVKHFFNVSAFYTHNQTRLSVGYMKQVAGIVCTGGVCRQEPAFSGIKFGVTTSF
jgi:hypothetical protein